MKIKIDKVNEEQLQKEIDQKRKEEKVNEACSITAHALTDYISRIDHLFNHINRSIDDYNGAKIKFRHTVKSNFEIDSSCLNFDLLIENGEYFLIGLNYAMVSTKSKHTKILLKPEYSATEEKEACTFKYGEIHGVKILLFEDVARIRFANYPIEFDYEIDVLQDFIGLIEAGVQNLKDNTRVRLLKKLTSHIRKSRVRRYVD